MDAVNLGRVGLFLRGEWLPDTSYVPLDVVSHDGASYAARLPSTNVEPSVANYAYWQVMAGNSVQVDDTEKWSGVDSVITNLKTLISQLTYTVQNHNGAATVAAIDALHTILSDGGTTYSITKTLSNCTLSNSATSAAENAAYSGTLTANTGYTLGTVTVTMGGTDITSTAYNSGTGAIFIASVTGNITITASATARTVSSIDATFTQGGNTIYDTTPLNDLKQYLVVTATYSDATTDTISSNNYSLSGTLTVGTSTITVSYGGKTTTFNVTVTAAPATLTSISAVLNLNDTIIRDGDALNDLKQYLTVTATYSDSSTAVVNANDYTLSGSLALASGEYDCSDQTITVNYSGKTTTFNVTVYNTMTADRVILPSGYTQLSMIYSETTDSGPYINTGLNSGDVDHVKYGIQVCVEPGNGKNLHVLSNNRTYYPYFRKGNSGAKNFQVKNNTSSDSATGLDTTWDINTNYVIEAYPTVKINGVTVTTVADGGATGGSKLFIFARSGADNTPYNSAPLRFFYLQMFDSQNQLIHQYIPCKNDSNVVGMYDTVAAAFHTSGNAQTFSAGGGM